MKLLIAIGFAAGLFCNSMAQAMTCQEAAQECVGRSATKTAGVGKSSCLDPSRIATCNRTGVFVAPNGHRFPASPVKH